MRSKPFIAGLIALMADRHRHFTLRRARPSNKVDKSLTAFVSPDGRYKAVRLSLARSGAAPFCFESVSIFLAVYPDTFAENEKAYQVYATPCATPAKPGNAPADRMAVERRAAHHLFAGAGRIRHQQAAPARGRRLGIRARNLCGAEVIGLAAAIRMYA